MKATGLKRMFAVILVLILVLSLSAPAFAAEAEQPAADTVCTGLEDCPAAQHNEGCLKATEAAAVPAGNSENGAEGEDPVQEPAPPACTCGAAEGAAHAEGCPLYVAPACTCGAAEGAAHAAECPLYVAPTCTCGAAEDQPHAEGCPLYETPTGETAANVQAMIDALPEASAVTAENADAVKAQLEAIDAAKLLLTDEQLDGLNIERYVAVAAALDAVYEAMALANAVAKIGEQPYETLQAAVDAAGVGDVITLSQTISDCQKIVINKPVTINLNGNNIGFALQKHFWVEGGTLNLTGSGKLYEQTPYFSPVVMKGSAISAAENYSVVNVDSGVTLEGWAGLFIDTNKGNNWGISATVNGTLTGQHDGSSAGYGLYVNGQISDAGNAPKITLDGATVTAEDGGIGMYLAGYAETTVSNSTIASTSEGGTGIEIRAGELTIDNESTITGGGGTYTSGSNNNGATSQNVGLAVAQHTTKLPIKVRVLSGTLTGGAAFAETSPETNEQADLDKIELDIQGGNFNGQVHSEDKTDFITGGSFSEEVNAAYVPDGNETVQGTDNRYTIGVSDEAVAMANNRGYPSVQAAIDDIGSGTVDVIKNTAENVLIPEGAQITLNIAGGVTLKDKGDNHTITNKGTLTVTGGGTVQNTAAGHGALANYPGATANLNGCTFVGDKWYVIKNLGTMSIDGATVTQNDAGSSGIANGYYDDPINDLGLPKQDIPANLTITNGTFSGGMNTVKNDDYGVLIINGGTYTNTNGPTILNWNKATINNGSFTVNDTASSVVANGHLDSAGDEGLLTINGGTFTAANGGQGMLLGYGNGSTTGGEVKITNGTFEGKLAVDGNYPYKPVVSGGTFSEPVAEAYCATGYRPTDVDANGNYTVCDHTNPELVPELAATCKDPGRKPHYHCAKCGRDFADSAAQNEITDPNTLIIQVSSNHTYDTTAWFANASQHWHECTVCHKAKTDVANHSFQWVDVNGVKHYVCSTCGYANTVTLTLHFDPNQGKKAPADQTVDTDTGSGTIVITNLKPYRFGHFFQGWSTTRDGKVQYRPGDAITIKQDTTLYAVWARPTDSPRTGDTSNIVLWAAVAGVCLVGIGVAVVIIKKKGGKE